jgi:hypothetical protein
MPPKKRKAAHTHAAPNAANVPTASRQTSGHSTVLLIRPQEREAMLLDPTVTMLVRFLS